MNIKLVQLFGCLFVLFFAAPVSAEDRTVEEFKEYIIEKTGDLLNERQLDAVVEKVDSDSDGTITDEEFETRHEAIREVLAESVPDKAESDEDPADSTEDSKESTEDPAESDEDSEKSDEDSEKSDEDSDPKSDDSADSPEDSEPKPDENEAYYESLEPVVIQPLTDSTDASVLLITANELAEAWLPYAKWKTQNGKVTKIITVAQIAADYEADSIQEKIRLCVREHIENHATKWVVLGGDCVRGSKSLVPGGHTTVHSRERRGIPTDIVYLSPTNWDADEDGIYGEFDDDREAISYPDGTIGLGRIPVRTVDDVAAFTDKVIAYESNYPTTSFARNMIYTCTDKPAYPKVRKSWDEYLSKVWDGEMNRFFAHETPWDDEEEPGSYQLSADNVVQLFNDETTGKLHIHGHGFLPAWILEKSKFTERHIEQLENKGAYPLITTVSCNTGEYDSPSDPSIVEQILRLPNAGSVAVVAPVRTGKPHFAKRSDMRLMFSEGKLDGTSMTMTSYWSYGLGEGHSTGHAMMMAKSEIRESAEESAAFHLCLCELNLLGDPTLDMRADVPMAPTVEIKSTTVKRDHQITVTTDAPGCQVCMWNGTDEYQVATADDKGIAVAVLNSDPSDVTFTVSGANLNSVTQKGVSK